MALIWINHGNKKKCWNVMKVNETMNTLYLNHWLVGIDHKMVMPSSNRKKLEQTCIKKIEVVGYKFNIKKNKKREDR